MTTQHTAKPNLSGTGSAWTGSDGEAVKERANRRAIFGRYEIYFDGDQEQWYMRDTVTEKLIPCTDRQHCEIEVALWNLDWAMDVRNAQKQLRFFR